MIRVRPRRAIDRISPVEITPMIDVVFLLIIFFMTTARFAADTRAELDLPQEAGEQSEENEEAGLIVNIDRTGVIVVAQSELTLEELEARLRVAIDRAPARDATQTRVLVRADRRAPAAHLNDVVRLLQDLGVGAARVATEVPR